MFLFDNSKIQKPTNAIVPYPHKGNFGFFSFDFGVFCKCANFAKIHHFQTAITFLFLGVVRGGEYMLKMTIKTICCAAHDPIMCTQKAQEVFEDFEKSDNF